MRQRDRRIESVVNDAVVAFPVATEPYSPHDVKWFPPFLVGVPALWLAAVWLQDRRQEAWA